MSGMAVAAAAPRQRSFQDVLVVSFGHALTHWYPSTFYLLLPLIGKELASYFDRFMLPQAGAALSAGHGSAAPAGLRAHARWLHSGSASTTA